MITPNAVRQARWRAKRNRLAKQASTVGGLITAPATSRASPTARSRRSSPA
jgi:hypothetical protein